MLVDYHLIVLLGVAIITILVVKSLIAKRHLFEFASKQPGFRFFPIIGNGYQLYGKHFHEAFQLVITKFGLPCNLWLGHSYNYITADSNEVKVILNHPDCIDKSDFYDEFEWGFANTLLVASGDVWRKHRKFLSRSFSKSLLDRFVEDFYSCSQLVVDMLMVAQPKNVCATFERLSLAAFYKTMLCSELDQTPLDEDMIKIMEEAQEIGAIRLTHKYLLPLFLYVITKNGFKLAMSIYKLQRHFWNSIKENRERLQANPICSDSMTPLPLMELIMQGSTVQFTDRHTSAELFFFAMAAADTSGISLAYIFTLLGMNPDIQEKLYDEVVSVVGHDRAIEIHNLPSLKYTERVILEGLRILPVVPYFGRRATANIDLGYKIIPKGANIMISTINVHRNEKYWPNPLQFDPDRFLPEIIANRDPNTFLSFSNGPRNCIGKTYAMMLMKVVVANVIRRFSIHSPYKSIEDIKFRSYITMLPIHKLKCEFIHRF